MPTVSVVILPFRRPEFILQVFGAVFSQTYAPLDVIAVLNDSTDGSREILSSKFPDVAIVDPGFNSMFAAGNNLGIQHSKGEFIQLVNDDVILEPTYILRLLEAFVDTTVGAATGKLLRYDFDQNAKTSIIDSTGIAMTSSGRAKDRGQLDEDRGQYDEDGAVFAVSGAAAMYRRSALEAVKYCEGGRWQYFDEDLAAYWEDVDLSWRLNKIGYKNLYVAAAVAYHGRTGAQAKLGWLPSWHFVSHRNTIPLSIRRLDYRNHILVYLKNAPHVGITFCLRECLLFGYLLLFERSTLTILPELVRLIRKNRRKQSAATVRQ